MSDDATESPNFAFVACSPATVTLCKREIARHQPDWLPAFSRPGFLTWKVPATWGPQSALNSLFARTWGLSLAQFRVAADDTESLDSQLREAMTAARQRLQTVGMATVGLHYWQRAGAMRRPRRRDEVATQPEQVTGETWPELPDSLRMEFDHDTSSGRPQPDGYVDVCQLDPGHWVVGCHAVQFPFHHWPGGIPPLTPPDPMISRAWLKLAEALLWSGLAVRVGDHCLEIGSAPGGSCQRLLQLGARVTAVDPAKLDPRIASHPKLRHVRKRGRDLPHRDIADARWLFVDTNIAPESAVAMAESLVTSRRARFEGGLLTLKMLNEDLIEKLPTIVERVREWGFSRVATRHLALAKAEICLAFQR